MGSGDIKIIKGNKGCGMGLFSLELTQRLLASKGMKFVGEFKLGSYKVFDKEEFLESIGRINKGGEKR